VASDPTDGSIVYVPVLIPPPAGESVRLPAPKNGQRFRAASLLLGGQAVKLSQSAEGVELSLSADARWDPADMVIVLKVDATAAYGGFSMFLAHYRSGVSGSTPARCATPFPGVHLS